MLVIDDNMFKLARMQESLLKVATGDRSYHLNNYIKNITAIDAKLYDNLVNIMKETGKYNQTLEDELLYLDKVKKNYDQLFELQMRFKNICEQYGEDNLALSDMSLLNIEYVDNRISSINGYLTNIKNIEINKSKLESLNEKLVDEEKKREFLDKKILLFEKKLRDDFVHASLKQVVFGKLESFDIISEYSKLGYDVVSLLDNPLELDNKYRNINVQNTEISEKYEAAKLCYNNLFNTDSKNIISDIEKEFYLSKYKYIMLKLLKLLVNEALDYDGAKVKRENFLELINNRNVCLKKLGINNPLNIVNIVDIDAQLKEIAVLSETVKNIHSIRKEISELSNRTEDMINQNNNYLISLSDTKEMILSKVGFNDVDITSLDDIIEDEVEKNILDNQVVMVKSISSSFKLLLSKQKAYGVIERICKMNAKNDGVYDQRESMVDEVIPDLVIGPMEEIPSEITENVIVNDETSLEIVNDGVLEVSLDNNNDISKNVDKVVSNKIEFDSSIFATTVPFSEPVMFADRTDSVVEVKKEDPVEDLFTLPILDTKDDEPSVLMPDVFWTVDSNVGSTKNEVSDGLSFDEQINALLAESQKDQVIMRR